MVCFVFLYPHCNFNSTHACLHNTKWTFLIGLNSNIHTASGFSASLYSFCPSNMYKLCERCLCPWIVFCMSPLYHYMHFQQYVQTVWAVSVPAEVEQEAGFTQTPTNQLDPDPMQRKHKIKTQNNQLSMQDRNTKHTTNHQRQPVRP